MANKLIS